MATGALCCLDTPALALTSLLALQLGKRGKGLGDEAADRRGIVQPGHIQNPYQNATPVLLIEKDDQFTGASPEPIQALDHQLVAGGQTSQLPATQPCRLEGPLIGNKQGSAAVVRRSMPARTQQSLSGLVRHELSLRTN